MTKERRIKIDDFEFILNQRDEILGLITSSGVILKPKVFEEFEVGN